MKNITAMRRYQILSSFDRAKIKRELGEDYKDLKAVHEAQCRAFKALSDAEKALDFAEATGNLERVGRPPKAPGEKRVVVGPYTVAPETAAAIDQDRREGESKGAVLDRWARERSEK